MRNSAVDSDCKKIGTATDINKLLNKNAAFRHTRHRLVLCLAVHNQSPTKRRFGCVWSAEKSEGIVVEHLQYKLKICRNKIEVSNL